MNNRSLAKVVVVVVMGGQRAKSLGESCFPLDQERQACSSHHQNVTKQIHVYIRHALEQSSGIIVAHAILVH